MSGTGDTFGRAIGNSGYTVLVLLVGMEYYLFTWYLIATLLLIIFLILTFSFLSLLQKYTIIKVEEKSTKFE